MCKEGLRCRALCGLLRRRCSPPLFCASFLNKLVSPNQQHNFSFRFAWQPISRRSTTVTMLIWCAIFPFIIFIFLRCNLSATLHRCRRTRIQFIYSILVVVGFFFLSLSFHIHIQSFEILLARSRKLLLSRRWVARRTATLLATKKMPWVKSFWVQSFVNYFYIYSSMLTGRPGYDGWCTMRTTAGCIARFTCQPWAVDNRDIGKKMHSKLQLTSI